MHIYGPTHLHGPQSIGSPHAARGAQPENAKPGNPIQDELQLSDAAQVVDKMNEIPEIRQDRVDAIRAEIAAGTYETDEKLEAALDRLLDEIG
jgi:negative regulator of flagellin synthesis FlgM